jgi:phosphoenolpyruvate carboxykinase (ATP)
VWLVNTGWTGGGIGKGRRISLGVTRQLVRAALSDQLAEVAFAPDPVFGVLVPAACPGVPPELLRPRNTWAEPVQYDRQARMLAELFQRDFKGHEACVGDEVRRAGPRV